MQSILPNSIKQNQTKEIHIDIYKYIPAYLVCACMDLYPNITKFIHASRFQYFS